MSEKENNVATAEATVKKHRRGVSNETRAAAQLKFHEKDAAPNGLFVGHLVEAKVDWSVGSEASSFNGVKTPRLTFHFASNHTNINEQRHVYQTLFPVESNVATIPGGDDEWRVNSVFTWIKHILDIYYLKGRELSDAEEDAMTLPFEDYTENEDGVCEYVSVDPETVAAGYGELFNNVVAILNGTFGLAEGATPKCHYKDANGKFITVWMKLLRHIKNKKGWVNVASNGDLAFPGFVGSGVLEIMKDKMPPAILRIDLVKESITPKETKKEPTLGGQAGMGIMGGMVMPGMPGGIPAGNDAFNAAGDGDMPF